MGCLILNLVLINLTSLQREREREERRASEARKADWNKMLKRLNVTSRTLVLLLRDRRETLKRNKPNA